MKKIFARVVEFIAVLGKRDKRGKRLEFNIVDWNGTIKFDIRKWDEAHEDPDSGIRLTKEETRALRDALSSLDL